MVSSAVTVRPRQLADILAVTINAREPVLIKGSPGVGKSDIVSEATRAAGGALVSRASRARAKAVLTYASRR